MPALTEEMQEELYGLYLAVFHSRWISAQKKRTLLSTLVGWDSWTWPVVGITETALSLIRENNWNRPSRCLVRDHPFPRAETFDALLATEGSSPVGFDDFWIRVLTRDRTVLMTNEEHLSLKRIIFAFPECQDIETRYAQSRCDVSEGRRVRIYPVDSTRGLFEDLPGPGFKFRKSHEGKYLEALWDRLCNQ